MKITFLGTSDAIPTASRNHTAVLLNWENENILIDCGEGTQRQFRKAKINPCNITRLLITHWHGDHVLGIPGLLQTLTFSGYNKTLKIYGPRGTRKYMKELTDAFIFTGKLKIEIKEIDKGKFVDEKDFYLEAERMTHGCPTLAYSFVKKGKLRIDKKKLKQYKLAVGVHLQKLKQGKDVVYEGKKYLAKNLTYIVDEEKISFVFDTSFNNLISKFVKGAKVFVCESQFGSDMERKAKEHKHMTSVQSAKIAKEAKVGRLYLTHISQRYEKNFDKLLKEARKIFKNSHIARDLEVVEVK